MLIYKSGSILPGMHQVYDTDDKTTEFANEADLIDYLRRGGN